MQAPPALPESELLAAREDYLAAFRNAPPRLAATVGAWLEMIVPPRWALEWSLPYWLGEGLRLPSETTRRLVVSNIVGLAYIRLQDALADEETLPIQPAFAPLLSTLLYQRWMQEYIELFGGDQRFWALFNQYLSEWLEATTASNEMPEHGFQDYTSNDFLRLAHRGAPLKVCCAGACLLAGQEGVLPALAVAIDHLLAGAVLLDHVQDWSDDLAAGRYNAFVAYASPLPQTPENPEINKLKVQEDICLGKAARPYFQVVHDHLREARKNAEAVNCPDLDRYLAWLEKQAARYRGRIAESATALLDDAVRRLLGPASVTGTEQSDPRKGGFSND